MESTFRVKIGDRWSVGTYGMAVEFAEDGREFSEEKHAKSHIRHINYRRNIVEDIEIVEHDPRKLPDGMRWVRLPQTDPVLADSLESMGYLEQANMLRGIA